MRTNQRIATVFLSGIAIAFGLVWLLGDPSALLPDRPPGLENNAGGTVARPPAASAPGAQPRPESRARNPEPRTAGEPTPATTRTIVWGTVQTSFRDIVEGEKVTLYSGSRDRRYTGTSDENGEFRIDGVQAASDYNVSVKPKGMFKRYTRGDLEIEGTETALGIVLEPLRTGVLQGEIVNAEGRPVPDFSFFLRSLSKDHQGIRRMRSDTVGRFSVERFPEGPFEVTTRKEILSIRGLSFDPDANEILVLAVDNGPHRLTGTVYDVYGHPHMGVTALLTWTHSRGEARTYMERRTLTDERGSFTMDGLGPGRHQLLLATHDGNSLQRSVRIGEAPGELILQFE